MIAIGQTISHYSVLSKLGKGGMGEVYRAKDQTLGRDVAIKVLPEEFAQDADRIARFQREAKLLASLNHPNIAAIHGLEESDGKHFLVMELIEGDTLADRLRSGPIATEESLKIARQIAEALEAAHEKDIIHRDLKPANVKVTPEGKVKVLDFGLAKAYAGNREELNLSNSPTLSVAATQQGMILGTAAYMSPEQARGKSVDKGADIWAFGCVLFEMLTGHVAFRGEDVSEILASVIKGDVKLDLLPANLHWRVREVITRCLQRDLKKRYSSITDARYEIEQALADPSGLLVQPVSAAERQRKSRKPLIWAAITLILVLIAGAAVWKLKPSEPRQVMRFEYYLPEDQALTTTGSPLAVSPDGKQFVYGTINGLYIRSVDELTAKQIAGTEGRTQQPFFSPDGKSIGYFSVADRQLKKISISGGAPVTLCRVNQPVGAWWSADNKIVYGQYPMGAIMRVSANGGTPEALITPKVEMLLFPQVLPDGESVLYTSASSTSQMRVMVKSPKSSEPKELFAGAGARYLPTGHIVYALPNNSNLFAVAFDLDRLEVEGGPVPIVEGMQQFAVSEAGTLVYLPGMASTDTQQPGRTLVWVDRDGKEEPLGAPPDQYIFPRISPDGTRVALTILGDNNDIWVWDLARKTNTRLTFDKGSDIQPIWTPDGKQVLFFTTREGTFGGIFRKKADGTGEDQKVVAAPDRQLYPWDLTGDGKTLVVLDTTDPYTRGDISMLSMEGDHARKPLLDNPDYNEVQPRLSPDGKWLAYISNESGRPEVYVRPFPEVNKGRWQVSTKGGVSPIWAPNGRELYYFSEDDSSVTAVAVEMEQAFSAGIPKKLFSRSPYFGGGNTPGTPWDIYPDGKRFLMMKLPASAGAAAGSAAPNKINIVLNWLEELKQRVPVK